MVQALQDMFSGTGGRFARGAVALACATALATPTAARAQEPAAPLPDAATEDLGGLAQKHAIKAVEHFKSGAYVDSEEEFRRVAFYAPTWRPLHFNLAVLAEAQGKIGTAVREYKQFRPLGSLDEQMLVDQRLDELGRRRAKISAAYRRQIALSSVWMTLGVLGVAGSVVGFVFYARQKEAYDEAKAFNNMSSTIKMEEKKPSGGLLFLGVYGGLFGLILAGASVFPLRNAIKSKRQLDGLALGPTRLRWTGGAGVQLRF